MVRVSFLLGYGIGALFWDMVGARLVEIYGGADQFRMFQSMFQDWGVWIIIFKALTPIPFKFAAIAAGLARMDIWTFTAAALVSRALHFLFIAALVQWLGPRFLALTRQYETKAAVIVLAVLVCALVYVGLRA